MLKLNAERRIVWICLKGSSITDIPWLTMTRVYMIFLSDFSQTTSNFGTGIVEVDLKNSSKLLWTPTNGDYHICSMRLYLILKWVWEYIVVEFSLLNPTRVRFKFGLGSIKIKRWVKIWVYPLKNRSGSGPIFGLEPDPSDPPLAKIYISHNPTPH